MFSTSDKFVGFPSCCSLHDTNMYIDVFIQVYLYLYTFNINKCILTK